MKISQKKLKLLIKESFLKNLKRGIASTFNIESMKDTPRKPLNPVSNTALFMTGNKNSGRIILYTKTLPSQEVTHRNYKEFQNVIGYIKYNTTLKPCIPETVEIKFIAVDKPYQNRGYGPLLNGILFQYAKDNGLGVTSDHTQSTSPAAAAFWNKLPYTTGYYKKTTDKGNSHFDYTGATSDPNDDCNAGMFGDPSMMATHHSWYVNHDNFKTHMEKLLIAHEAHIDYMLSMTNSNELKNNLERYIERDLKEKSSEVFIRNMR